MSLHRYRDAVDALDASKRADREDQLFRSRDILDRVRAGDRSIPTAVVMRALRITGDIPTLTNWRLS